MSRLHIAPVYALAADAAGVQVTLPAAGAETQGYSIDVGNCGTLALWLWFTRGSALSYPRLRFIWTHLSNGNIGGATEYRELKRAGTQLQDNYFDWIVAADDDLRVLRLDIPDGAMRFALRVNEQGDVANPGDLQALVTLSR
jgi:hypothetical protein